MEFLKNVVDYILPLLVLALAGVGLLWLRREKQRLAASDADDTEQKAQYIARAEAWLLGALPALITKAENEWFTPGEKTGQIKKSAVKAELLKIAPPELIATISGTALEAMINIAVDEAKVLWGETPALLAENLIKSGDQDGEMLTEVEPQREAVKVCNRKMDLCAEGQVIVTPLGADGTPVGEAEEAFAPVGHHWEPDGNGGFVAVLDAIAAGSASAEDGPQPKRRKRMVGTVQPMDAPEEPAVEDEQEGPTVDEDAPAAEEKEVADDTN